MSRKAARILNMCIILFCLAGFSACGLAGGENQEIKDYLESRYGSMEFEITKVESDGGVSYRVVPADYPEAAFTVEEGSIEESWHWNYHDDFAAQMIYGGAQRLGLTYEKENNGYNIFVLYEDYLSLDQTAEKVEKLVLDCAESHAFDSLQNTCLITIKPENETDPAFPGYEIRIKTKPTYPLDKKFGIMASDLVPGQLKDALALKHVYNTYHYTIPRDADLFSQEDMERYLAMCTGAMGKADDGSITIYDKVDQENRGLNFGGAYQILSAEGLVTEEGLDSFIASGNGLTVKFFRTLEGREPGAAYEVLSGEGLPEGVQSTGILHAVNVLTDKDIEFSTPEKTAAAEEAERLERLPQIQAAFAQAQAPGQAVSCGGLEITVTGMELHERLQGSNSFYLDSNQDTVWTSIRIQVKNTGSEEIVLFPYTWMNDSEGRLFGIAADEEANLYRFSDIINMGLEDIYGVFLPAGETVEGNVYLKLPRKAAEKEGSLVLCLLCCDENASALISAKEQ